MWFAVTTLPCQCGVWNSRVRRAHRIPAHALSHSHGDSRRMPVGEPVDGLLEVGAKGGGLNTFSPPVTAGVPADLRQHHEVSERVPPDSDTLGSVVYVAMFSSTCQLEFSSTSMKPATISRSTSTGELSGRAMPAGDDQRSDQAAGHVADLIVMRVIHPECRTALVLGGTRTLRHWPHT